MHCISFRTLASSLGYLKRCPTDQLQALADKAKAEYGDVANWTRGNFQEAGIIAGRWKSFLLSQTFHIIIIFCLTFAYINTRCSHLQQYTYIHIIKSKKWSVLLNTNSLFTSIEFENSHLNLFVFSIYMVAQFWKEYYYSWTC